MTSIVPEQAGQRGWVVGSNAHLFTRSKAHNQERLTCPGGASATSGATAPNCCNCASVNSPFRMSTWPAGVVARRPVAPSVYWHFGHPSLLSRGRLIGRCGVRRFTANYCRLRIQIRGHLDFQVLLVCLQNLDELSLALLLGWVGNDPCTG